MSYDFRLCLPQEGRPPEEIAVADVEEGQITDPVPDKEDRKRRVTAALIASNPSLEQFAFGFEEIAEFERITVEEAKKRYRHVELNGQDNGNGIQIMVFNDEASVTVPYWHQGTAARRVFEEIWGYLKIMQHEGGYFVYDPQVERVLHLEEGFETSLSCYQRVSEEVATRLATSSPKRWWEFWK